MMGCRIALQLRLAQNFILSEAEELVIFNLEREDIIPSGAFVIHSIISSIIPSEEL
jgi:hypothetical protein